MGQDLIRLKSRCWPFMVVISSEGGSSSKITGCWQDSVSCGCRSEVSIFFLLMRLSAPRDHPQVLVMDSSPWLVATSRRRGVCSALMTLI